MVNWSSPSSPVLSLSVKVESATSTDLTFKLWTRLRDIARAHRSPGGNQPQKMTPDERLCLGGRDMSGEHARSDSDSIALRTIYAILSKLAFVSIEIHVNC